MCECDCCDDDDEEWNPALLPASDFMYWFKADAGVTLATGVSAWADQSGNGNHVSQAVAISQPAYSPNYRNGLPGIVFDGSNDVLGRATLTQGVIASPFREIIVYRRASSLVLQKCLTANFNPSNLYATTIAASTGRPGQFNSPTALGLTYAPVSLSFNILNGLSRGATSQLRNISEGVAVPAVTNGAQGTNSKIGVQIGAYQATQFFNSAILEVVGLRNITSQISNLVDEYLKAKWNIYP